MYLKYKSIEGSELLVYNELLTIEQVRKSISGTKYILDLGKGKLGSIYLSIDKATFEQMYYGIKGERKNDGNVGQARTG